MTRLRVLLLSDGRPGHYHLAEGVCAALRRLRPVDVTTLRIDRGKMPTRLMTGALRTGLMTPALVLWWGYGLRRTAIPETDLVISAGGDTIAANVAAARLAGAPNIFCGSLRHATPQEMTLTVSSYARHEKLPGHVVCLKPTAMDPDALGRPAVVPAFGPAHPPRTAALLIGGDSGLFHYTAEEWRRLVAWLAEQHAAHGTRWLVSTSRRTPDWVADAISAAAADPRSGIAEVLDYRRAGPGTLPRLMAAADVVLCTEDSSTMVSETIAARLPVIGISPVDHAFKPEEAEYRALMLDRRWARFVPLADLTPERFLEELARVSPLTENHLATLASTLSRSLPHLAPRASSALV